VLLNLSIIDIFDLIVYLVFNIMYIELSFMTFVEHLFLK